MSVERPPGDIKALWRGQQMEESPVTLDNVHEHAQDFQSKIRNRNVREYIVGALGAAAFGFIAWFFPGWMLKTGSVLNILAVLFIASQLHRRAGARSLPDGAATTILDFHRGELVRQKDALRSAGFWYVMPYVPGSALMILGSYFQLRTDRRAAVLGAVALALWLLVVWLITALMSERLERKIDRLDKLRSGSVPG